MTPTQAQIEAAAKEIRIMLATVSDPTPENFAYVALTAAAEVGYNPNLIEIRLLKAERDELKDKLAATIERCAKVAENWQYDPIAGQDIAAAIRERGDKP